MGRHRRHSRSAVAVLREDRVATFLLAAFLLILSTTLLFFGSVGIAPFGIVSAAMFTLACVTVFYLGEAERNTAPFKIALAILLLLSAWILLQAFNLPAGAMPAAPIWNSTETLLSIKGSSISVAPADTMEALLRVAMPFVTFLLALMLSSSDERSKTLIASLGLIGGCVGLFGLVQFLVSPTTLIVVEKHFYADSLTTVFVNRNTAATFLGVSILTLSVLAWEKAQTADIRQAVFQMQDWRSPRGGGVIRMTIYSLLAAASLAALLLTKSRAGIASTFVALLFLVPFLVMNWTRVRSSASAERSRRGGRHIAGWAVSTVVIVALFLFLGGQVFFRAEVRGVGDERFCILPGILQALSQHYLVGTGFGTFRWIFPAYRDANCGIWGIWDRAHDFYLEGALNLGILFPITLLIGVGAIVYFLGVGLKSRRKLRHYPALGFAIMILVSLHSAIDFSLQIPGFAAFFAALLGPIISIACGRRPASQPQISN